MVRLRMHRGVLWPINIDFRSVPTPKRQSLSDLYRIIRFANKGCTNRPFYHIEVTKERFPKMHRFIDPIEQVGTYDPLVNAHGEKLVSLNIERINYYLAQGIKVDTSVAQLLGLAGLLPQHNRTYMHAWRNRKELEYQNNKKNQENSNEQEKSS